MIKKELRISYLKLLKQNSEEMTNFEKKNYFIIKEEYTKATELEEKRRLTRAIRTNKKRT